MTRQAPFSERVLVAATLAVLVWLPLPLGSNRDWAVGLFVLLMGGLGVLWGIDAWRRPRPLRRAHQAALPMLALLLLTQAWVAVQWLAGLSRDTGATFQYLLLGLGYSLLFWIVVSHFHTRERLTLLLWTLVISGTLQAFWGTFMTLSGTEWLLLTPKASYQGDATGTFVNRNHLAGYLEMTLACGIGLLLALRDNRPFSWAQVLELLLGPKARLRLALVVMVIGLVMSHSRMGNAAFFSSLLLIGGLYAVVEKEHRLRNGLILASILLIDMLVISQYFGLEKLKDRILSTQLSTVVVDGEVLRQANELRDDVFRAALPLAKARPLTGQGAGSFEAVFPAYAGPEIRPHFDHAHNDYLQFFIEYGLIGCLPLALFVLLALRQAVLPRPRRHSAYRRGVGFGAAMGIVALLIHSVTDFNLQIPANAATFITLCAIAVLAGSHSRSKQHGRSRGRPRPSTGFTE